MFLNLDLIIMITNNFENFVQMGTQISSNKINLKPNNVTKIDKNKKIDIEEIEQDKILINPFDTKNSLNNKISSKVLNEIKSSNEIIIKDKGNYKK